MLQREAITAPLCRGGILADDMGLGKTFTLIALLKNSPFPLWNTLLICPPVLLTAWVDELRACGIHVCQQITGLSSWDLPLVPGSVCITTYAKVARFSGLLRFQFQRVILDEGHLIRNGLRTKTGLAVHLLSKCAIARWIVSATPIQNSRAEWNHYCVFLRVLHHEDEDEASPIGNQIGERASIHVLLPGQDEQVGGLVGGHLDGAQQLVRGRVINVDGFAGLEHIQQAAV